MLHHLYIDDDSTDQTESHVRRWMTEHPDHNVHYVRNESRRGGTANTVSAFSAAPPGSVVAELNGDDWLPDKHVLAFLNKVYADGSVWMTYNSISFANGRPTAFSAPIPRRVIASRSLRSYPWVSLHLHTFRSELFSHVRPETLIDPYTGEYWESADDHAIYLAMIELAGNHARHVERITYVYNQHDQSEDVRDFAGSLDRATRIRAQVPYESLTTLSGAGERTPAS